MSAEKAILCSERALELTQQFLAGQEPVWAILRTWRTARHGTQ